MAEHTDSADEAESDDPLSGEVIDEAERLTRLAREAVDEKEAELYREARADVLADDNYTARVREDDDVLVLYPEEWVEDGTVHPERIEDIDRGVERPLSGAGDPDDWEAVREHNEAIVEKVEAEYDERHAANAQALAEFMNNHYAKPIEQATEAELAEFLEEYYPRNVWPTDDQKAVVEESVELVEDVTRRR